MKIHLKKERKHIRRCLISWLAVIVILAGCSVLTPMVLTPKVMAGITPSQTQPPQSSPVPTSAPATATATETPLTEICSPLQNWSLAELKENITNPYRPPKFGSDDPHQAIDLTVFDASRTLSLQGESVASVLPGVVAGTIQDRFPYGNAILIETRLDALPIEWVGKLEIPNPLPAVEVQSALTCPPIEPSKPKAGSKQSIYLLYAHLQNTPKLALGDTVKCGMLIGNVGGTGNSLNPHLHLEMRIGPPGTVFQSMAHYDASASSEEIANYCAWRIGGVFYRIDPLLLLSQLP